MAKKKGGNGFLLEKGEKLLIAGGAAGLLAFTAWGVMGLADAKSPDSTIKEMTAAANSVNQRLGAPGQTPEKLPNAITDPPKFPTVLASQFPLVGPPFEPVHQPDMKRENPRVLGVVAWQLDPIRVPMKSLDILEEDVGGVRQVSRIGVLAKSVTAVKSAADLKNDLKKLEGRFSPRPGMAKTAPRRPVRPPSGNDPMGSGQAAQPTQRVDTSVQYIKLEDLQTVGSPLAETIYPLDAIIGTLDFPLGEQIEEIKRALRLQSRQQAIAEANGSAPPTTTPMTGGVTPIGLPPVGTNTPTSGAQSGSLYGSVGPEFVGFEVMRREIAPNGEDLGWVAINHYDEYYTKIRARRIADRPDPPELLPFLRYDQKLVAPLPQLADGLESYPEVRLPAIREAIAKMKDEGKPLPTVNEWITRFQKPTGDANPYSPQAPGSLGSAVGGNPMGTAPGTMPPGITPPLTPMPGVGPAGSQPANALPDVDHTLIRFIDADVVPGFTYQYRVRVLMKNPNLGKASEVREPNDSKVAVLEGPWVEIPERVSLPSPYHLYAYDTGEYLKEALKTVSEVTKFTEKSVMRQLLELPDLVQGRRAVVQVQQWLSQVRSTGDNVEPVGAWIEAEFPVAPGEFIGRRAVVKLPLWSSAAHNYVLRELNSAVAVKGLSSQPKGWPVNFRTKHVLVDFEGGPVKTQVAGQEINDGSESELLILQPDGKLMLKRSGVDMQDKLRLEKDRIWTEWINRIKDNKEAPGTGPAGANNPFSREPTKP